MHIDTIVIHPVKCSCCIHKGDFYIQ